MKKHRCFLFLNFCIVVILMTACDQMNTHAHAAAATLRSVV